jgi:hypothetical protein
MSDRQIPEWGAWLLMTATAIGGLLVGFGTGRNVINARWHTWSCAQGGATLVADSLCVRPDTSYRVPEPPKSHD